MRVYRMWAAKILYYTYVKHDDPSHGASPTPAFCFCFVFFHRRKSFRTAENVRRSVFNGPLNDRRVVLYCTRILNNISTSLGNASPVHAIVYLYPRKKYISVRARI